MASVSSLTIWLHKGPSIFNFGRLVFLNWGSLVMDRDSWFFTRWVSGLTKTIFNKICGSHFYFAHIENHTPVEIWRIHQTNFTRGLTNHNTTIIFLVIFADKALKREKVGLIQCQSLQTVARDNRKQCQCPNIVLNSKASFYKRKQVTWHSPVKAVIGF